MKKIQMSNGTNDHSATTKATTEAGYIRTARKAWPYAGMVNLRIRVEDDTVQGDPVVYETKQWLHC